MQRKAKFLAALIAIACGASVATAQQGPAQQGPARQAPVQQAPVASLQGIRLNPGERLVAINGVPVDGRQQRAQSAPIAGATPTSGPATHSANIVGNLVRSGRPFSHTPGVTALDKANAERQRRGQRPLLPDPQLQALALRKATIAAQRRHKNHIGGSLGGAKCEGVGHTNGRFLSCCLDEPGTYGGAAMVQGADGWYCCLLVR